MACICNHFYIEQLGVHVKMNELVDQKAGHVRIDHDHSYLPDITNRIQQQRALGVFLEVVLYWNVEVCSSRNHYGNSSYRRSILLMLRTRKTAVIHIPFLRWMIRAIGYITGISLRFNTQRLHTACLIRVDVLHESFSASCGRARYHLLFTFHCP